MTTPLYSNNLFLIGYRCTGKTSVGRLVAEGIGWNFIDADQRLMETTGKTVSQIVSEGGWPLFRSLEKKTLQDLCKNRHQVVATGGGVVTDDDNVALIKRHGVVVWLRAEVKTIYQRMLGDVQTDTQRPSLTQSSLQDEIRETLAERTPCYSAAAAVEVDTEGKSLAEVAAEVLSLVTI